MAIYPQEFQNNYLKIILSFKEKVSSVKGELSPLLPDPLMDFSQIGSESCKKNMVAIFNFFFLSEISGVRLLIFTVII